MRSSELRVKSDLHQKVRASFRRIIDSTHRDPTPYLLVPSLKCYFLERHWIDFRAHINISPSRDYHSTLHTRDRHSRSVLGALSDLASTHQSQSKFEPPNTQTNAQTASTEQRLEATFEAPVRLYHLQETTADRWRYRGRLLGGFKRREADGKIDRERALATSNGEVIFNNKHQGALRVPSPDNLKSLANQGHVVHKLSNMRSFVQVLTTPTADTPGTTLLLHFDNKRYLIGSLAEGTQRACVQMGARLLKVSECFLTGRTEWKNTGGLIGMILTLADSAASSQASSLEEAMKKVKSKAKRLGVLDDPTKMKELEAEAKQEATNTLTIFGPPNLNHTLATARRYVFRKGMPVNIHEIREETLKGEADDEWKPTWADENIKVWAMSISPSGQANATPPASVSPRKRSFDEMHNDESQVAVEADLSPRERDYLTVKAVVSEMFNSSWRLDTLYETPLSEVKLPATIFVRNSETNKIEKYRGPFPGGPQPLPDPQMTVLVRRPWPGALVESLPSTEPAKEAVSYIVRNHTQRGKFRPERAEELKVPKGRAWSDLSRGESVQNADGETITPDMVLDPSRVGGGMAIVDLPTTDYIDAIIQRPEWRQTRVMEGVGAFMWICGEGVAQDARLHDFMKEFDQLEHVISSPDYCPNSIALDSAAAATIRLREVDPKRYSVPVHDADLPDGSQSYGGTDCYRSVRQQHPLPTKAHIAARGQVVQLEPSIEFKSQDAIAALQIPETAAEVPDEVMEAARAAQEATKVPDDDLNAWLTTLPNGAKDADITTLGTGSALPSKYRNVSATLVRVPGWGNVLLDCGENTLGQLKRVFTKDELKELLKELKIIFISHMHADHQLGTTSVIKAWYQEVHGSQPTPPPSPATAGQSLNFEAIFKANDRLAIISEPAMQHWLAEYSSVEDFGYSRIAPLSIYPSDLRKGQKSRLGWHIPSMELKLLSSSQHAARLNQNVVPNWLLNLTDIQAVAVQHCHGARAVSITFPSGFKLSYSGDCRPSKAFSQIGRGSTVCIHEATFDDELQGDAEAKNHSTTSEALGVAQDMNARACVLTHFSQRYQKVPVLERAEGDSTVGAPGQDDVPVSNGEVTPPEESANPDDSLDAPLEDVAATFPDQETSNGGRQYDLPSKKPSHAERSTSAPEAVKFKLTTDMKVCVAFDYMKVKVGDIGHMEKFTPALLKLFAEEEKEKLEVEVSSKGKAQSDGKGNGNGRRAKGKKGQRGNS